MRAAGASSHTAAVGSRVGEIGVSMRPGPEPPGAGTFNGNEAVFLRPLAVLELENRRPAPTLFCLWTTCSPCDGSARPGLCLDGLWGLGPALNTGVQQVVQQQVPPASPRPPSAPQHMACDPPECEVPHGASGHC